MPGTQPKGDAKGTRVRPSSVVDASRKRLYYVVTVAVLLLMIWPVATIRYPSMVDYPTHLARVKILRDWSHDATLRQRYELVWRPYPNLAIDLLGDYVFFWLNVPAAGRASLILLLTLFLAGCHFLGREAGQGSPVWTAPAAALLAYNSMFLYGFVNYNFGVALFFLALATWLWYRRRRSLARFLAVTLAATAAYLGHLMGIALLVTAMSYFTLVEAWRAKGLRKEFALDLMPLLPSVLLYASLGSQRGDTKSIVWGSLGLKARHMMVGLTTYNARLTALYFVCCAAALGILLWRARRCEMPNLFGLGCALIALALVAPAQQVLSGSDVDGRILMPALAIWLIAIPGAAPHRWATAAFALTLAALAGRIVEIDRYWRAGDALTESQLELFRSVPNGARIFPIFWFPTDIEQNKRERHLLHAVEYETVDRSMYFPLLTNVTGQQPVLLRDASYKTVSPGAQPDSLDWGATSRNYDFVYAYGVDRELGTYLATHYDLVDSAGKGKIYRLRHGR
jgi:hypothetical protein